MSDIFDRLPKACPTCGSEQPTTYYGSCFDNQHSTIFDPRLPMDPWHAYMNQLSRSLREVESLESQRDVYLRLLAERDERIGAAEAERDALAARLNSILDAIGDPDELRWHRWHCDDTGNGDDLRDLLVRIADAADPDRSEHGNLRPLTAEDEAIIEDVRRSVQPRPGVSTMDLTEDRLCPEVPVPTEPTPDPDRSTEP